MKYNLKLLSRKKKYLCLFVAYLELFEVCECDCLQISGSNYSKCSGDELIVNTIVEIAPRRSSTKAPLIQGIRRV